MTTAALPSLSEEEFMDQVTKLAKIYHWSWAHFRPAQTSRGWRTPVSGPLGAGWPDLLLAKPGRFLVAELKRDGAKLRPEQSFVLWILTTAGVETHIWHPADFDEIVAVLR